MPMKKRPLGKTGLEIPELVLGGGYVGGIMLNPDESIRRQALKKCLDAGSDWIDTAKSYGNGLSETNIGRLLAELPGAERPRISSKIGLTPEDLADPKTAVRQALEASLERLGLDSIEVFQLHNRIGRFNPNWISPYDVLRPGGVAEAFHAVREAGLTKHVGISAVGDPIAVRDVIASGAFETAQVYYNMLNPSAGRNVPFKLDTTDFVGLLGACKANGVGVFAIRILAAGVLATNVRHGREAPITIKSDPASEEARATAALAALGPRDEPTAASAVRFALTESRLSTAVFGAEKLEHIDIALAAQAAGPLEADALARLAQFP